MTIYYVFKEVGGGRISVTDDQGGAKLPSLKAGRNWAPMKTLDLKPGEHRIGASSDEIINAVAEKGYLLWPEGVSNP